MDVCGFFVGMVSTDSVSVAEEGAGDLKEADGVVAVQSDAATTATKTTIMEIQAPWNLNSHACRACLIPLVLSVCKEATLRSDVSRLIEGFIRENQ
jgi:hypothetical protein